MPKIVFIEPDGGRREVDAPLGITLMEAARQHGVRGVVAQCGGACACATCHVYVDDQWIARLAAVSDEEDALLDGTASERQPHSRLSCQIKITPELDGLVLRLPERQV